MSRTLKLFFKKANKMMNLQKHYSRKKKIRTTQNNNITKENGQYYIPQKH